MAPTKDDIDKPRLNQPKAPSSTKDWEAMDIFVFSNGQQYSPPRKYHLKADELNWWQTTLGYIARSQYGAMYSTVELHSIDGLKISSPVELRDGSAYVAVVPPDSFINAGYEKYIIKASKSWEKRQSKLKNATKEFTNSGQTKSNVGIEIPEEKSENSNHHVHEAGSSHRKKPQGTGQRDPKNNSASVVLKPKRRPYSGSNRTSILRKLNNELKTSPEARNPAKRKEGPIKVKEPEKGPLVENLNKSVKTGPAEDKTMLRPNTPLEKPNTQLIYQDVPRISENETYGKPIIKNISQVTVSVEKKESKVTDEIDNGVEEKEKNTLSNLHKVTVLADEKESTRNSDIEYILEDKEIIVISNPAIKEEDALLYMFWNLNDDTEENILSGSLIPNKLNGVQFVKETQTPDLLVKSITRASSPIIKPSRNNSKTKTDEATQLESLTNDEPLIAVTNNGDAINLKLNIELKYNGDVVSNVHANTMQRPQRTEDAGKEKQNTIDIGEIIKESKSLSDYECGCSKKDSKIYILQCTCDLQETTDNNDKMCRKKSGDNHAQKTYLIVIPVVTVVDKNSTRTRDQETSKQSAAQEVHNDDEIVTVGNFMDDGLEMCYFPRSFPLSIEYKEMSIRSVTNVDCYAMTVNSETTDSPSESKHASTQTEWCSIVLEVRRHEDGRYTFHLPPLQILRTLNKDV